MIEVRPIRPGEGAALLTMVRALAESHGFLDKQTATAEDLERALFAEHPIVGCLLAFVDGKPAGCAFWHRSFTTARGREVIYLEDLSVLPEFRRKGVARALLKDLAGEAKRRGYPSIYWLMKSWNEGARALYAETGAEIEEGLVFCRLADEALTLWAEKAP
ncbi:GNAT family N-acetyltransferase [Taklimakanibacter deserti]|uniref:GNAT family N-acetyltransferase n=1 Tax=Taklimakanibacter deserti TaxID=2267839 RepID=UPI0013C52907